VDDWNADLSPWEAPPVFGSEGFAGGAEATLKYVTDQLIPELTGGKDWPADPKSAPTIYIGGYSLAGFFALWAAYQTDVFQGVAAASPSVWFPGFLDYMRENRIHANSVYLSLGDREEKTRNPVMAAVGERIREANELLMNRGIHTILEWNQGNHFQNADIRTAKAFAWIMEQQKTDFCRKEDGVCSLECRR
jgi:predicted alpha/beta superfamily hydrolase